MSDVDLSQFRGKRALVCGGRDYNDRNRSWAALRYFQPSDIIEGGATGADALARAFVKTIMGRTPVSFGPALADIKRWGLSRALTMRNHRMLAEGKPDFVLAFPGGRGTEDMVSKAKAAGVPVLRVRRDGSVEVDEP